MDRPTFCRTPECRAQIVFIRSADGRPMPCEAIELSVWVPKDDSWSVAPRDPDAVMVMTAAGELVRGLRSRPLLPGKPIGGHEPHWKNCPGSRAHRREKHRA